MPPVNWPPEAAAIFKGTALAGDGVVEVDVQAQHPTWFFVTVGIFVELWRRADISLAAEMCTHMDDSCLM
ncbi:hypothetical protein KP22_18585 [Pectobacterium betavasculorum]|uniref:Uncharacterized protein n=1 Tax=Pectobacterium betavasculorum TaxID=55207 RepID=A0A093RPY5_9GAMM|nr:hypothetical protein KP22_18585 [Pectobacterium betavasculorum]